MTSGSMNQTEDRDKEVHVLTVDRIARSRICGGYAYAPSLRLAGRWLERAGITYRSRVRVTVGENSLTITLHEQNR